ncbi:MAG: right-handed parallel beta-helix repeat-containing protein [Paludibacter sp.]|jgi:hypothetical protein|nr:right-handed parallel beta-helix repeat-containing protein [Paludibacter sp.]
MKVHIFTILFLLSMISSLNATVYTVTSEADSGTGTLRQTITDANADAALPHTINFANDVLTITLASALPTINKAMTFDGGSGVTITGSSNTVNMVVSAAVLTVNFNNITFNGAVLSIGGTGYFTDCTFTGGGASALKVTNSVTCTNCLFYNNTNSGSGGTAINSVSSSNNLTLNNCIIRDNGNAVSDANGGAAIRIAGGNAASRLEMNNCLVYNNVNKSTGSSFGGGISSAGVTVINNCAIYNNQGNRGGGIALQVGTATYKSKLTMTNTSVSGNSLGSFVASAFGGGIYIQGGSELVTDNSSITNSTISGNSTPVIGSPVTTSAGGGVQIGGGGSSTWTPTITFTHCTIYGNNVQGNPASAISGGGIDRLNGNAVLNYSIVIGNNSNSTAGGRNITWTTGWLTSSTGRNMYEGGASWNSTTTTGNIILTDAPSTVLNTTLFDNGGTTALPDGSFVKTHALVASSAASNPTVAGSGTENYDQRGIVRSTPDMGSFEYVIYRSKTSGNWSNLSSWQSGDNGTWSDVTVVPTANSAGSISIQDDHLITVTASTTSPSLTIHPEGQLTVNSESTLEVSGNFTIYSSASGTGTFKNSGVLTVNGGTSKVQQYLTNQSWYLTSPVQGTVTPTNLTRIQGYNEGIGTGSDWSESGTTMTAKKGYIVNVNAAPNIVEFTGTINSGDISIPLTRYASSNVNKYGFNLIGNPYTAYLDWEAVALANASKMPTSTMWYRTRVSGSWSFSTVNGSGEASPNNVSSLIPPMQAFWVRASIVGNSNMELTTNMVHHDTNTNNKLKAPAALKSERTKVRLQVSNGTNQDELLLYTDEKASNVFDWYDSPKMSNENPLIPEIYTTEGAEILAINGLNTLPLNQEIGVAFVPGSASSFTLTANEISNLPNDVKVILKDNVTLAETDLTDGINVYTFSNETTSGNRFSLIFRTSGGTTQVVRPTEPTAQILVNAQNEIEIRAIEGSNYTIYNTTGQQIATGQISKNSLQTHRVGAGFYLVRVNNIIKKLTINNL